MNVISPALLPPDGWVSHIDAVLVTPLSSAAATLLSSRKRGLRGARALGGAQLLLSASPTPWVSVPALLWVLWGRSECSGSYSAPGPLAGPSVVSVDRVPWWAVCTITALIAYTFHFTASKKPKA